jgi:hypothetical protein
MTDPRAWSGQEGDVVIPHLHREVLCTILTAALVVTIRGQAIRAESPAQMPSVPRVRSSDQAIAGLIERGASQSPTFKRILAAVEGSNGIVYVEPGVCRQNLRACLKIAVQVSGPNRLLSVVVDKRRAWSDVELIGSIGHELQHAIEALSDPSVTDGAKLYNFFRRYAPTDGNRFETTAAVNIGNSIRDELRRP